MAECLEIIHSGKSNLSHPVYKFTTVNENDKIACKACGHIFPGNHAGNIRKHIQHKHKKDNAELETLLREYYHKTNEDAAVIKINHRGLRCKSKGNLITVVHDVTDIKMGLVEMCSVNMCSFHQMKNSGFSRIMAPIIRESRKCNIPLSTQPEALHEYSDFEFSKMQNIVKDELQGKVFSIMVDATTTQNRSILGIAAQFIQNDKVVIRTLALRRLMEDPNAINLSNIIKTVLFEYGVNAACVYSITTDNEASVQKCVRDTAVISKLIAKKRPKTFYFYLFFLV